MDSEIDIAMRHTTFLFRTRREDKMLRKPEDSDEIFNLSAMVSLKIPFDNARLSNRV